MPRTTPVSELKDRLSAVLAEVEATGEPVLVTRHGKVVAQISPAPSSGVVLGLGSRPGVSASDLSAFDWPDDELDEMLADATE